MGRRCESEYVEEAHEYPILVAHSDYGDPESCGIIMPSRDGAHVDLKRNPGTADVDLMCNECGTVINSVPVAEAEATLLRMSMGTRRVQPRLSRVRRTERIHLMVSDRGVHVSVLRLRRQR